MLRKVITAALLLATVLMGAVTLTAPMISATAPAVLTIGLAAATYVAWPKRRKS